MNYTELYEYSKRDGFKPITIRMVDGRSYDIESPWFLLVTQTHVFIGEGEWRDGFPEDGDLHPLNKVDNVTPLQRSTRGGSK